MFAWMIEDTDRMRQEYRENGLTAPLEEQREEKKQEIEQKIKDLQSKKDEALTIQEKEVDNVFLATVTAYNTVEWQTDSTPCLAAGGHICGRTDVIACPSVYALGTWVHVEGMGEYECMDRTATKYNGRFDISFDKDIDGAIAFGKKTLEVTIL